MQSSFGQFLRTGGNGEFVLSRGTLPVGRRVGLSVKSEFPGYEALRSEFEGRLDRVVEENTAMILGVIGDTFTTPLMAADLANMSVARGATLAERDRRMEAIWAEWHTHPQRLRTVRQSMEDRLLTGFRGLVNELRQHALGIERYVWRSRDDARVRRSHADYDDRIFDWARRPRAAIRVRPGIAAVMPNRSCRMNRTTFLTQA